MASKWKGIAVALWGCAGLSAADGPEDFSADLYGFVRANAVAASRAVSSFGGANLSAPTSVYPNQGIDPDRGRLSFQAQQSRLGVKLKTGDVSGQFEADFVDFSKATPIASAVPRLRVAALRYQLSATDSLELGQDWGVFSPGKPFTYDPVALWFEAGNASFLRPIFRWDHAGEKVLVSAEMGMQGKNATANDSDLERSLTPEVSVALSYKLSEASRFGLSVTATQLRFSQPVEANAAGYGVDAYFEGKPAEDLDVHAAVYYGQNLANLAMSTLGQGTATQSAHEVGGYLTAQYRPTPSFKITGGIGGAFVTEANGAVMTGPVSTHRLSNTKLALALGYQAAKPLEFFVEDAELSTRFVDLTAGTRTTLAANLWQLGAVYTF